MEKRIPGYSKVWQLGHISVMDIFQDEVVVQEKVDGSLFSAAILDGVLKFRSKGAELFFPTNNKLFSMACATFQALFEHDKLRPGYIYRGEAITAPKHNALEYNRIPRGGVILFDIQAPDHGFLSPDAVRQHATEDLDLEVVPTFFKGIVKREEIVETILGDWLKRESYLGGPVMEGVVVKNYYRWSSDGKNLMGKYVREDFKEINAKNWKGTNQSHSDILFTIAQSLKTEARWLKSIQHAAEDGKLTYEPKDIGMLIKLIQDDVKEEAADFIKQQLYAWGWPQIQRMLTGGFAEWYKRRLLQRLEDGGISVSSSTDGKNLRGGGGEHTTSRMFRALSRED